jgi:hypothetical protein
MQKILLTLCFVLQLLFVQAQALYKVDNEEKEQHATLIIEGKVVEKTSFWNTAKTMIYTTNKVQVLKVFKGDVSEQFVEIITQGGSVENESVEVSELLELNKNHVGVFFCYPNQLSILSPLSNKVLLDVYASAQGFIMYDLFNGTAADPFHVYSSIEGELYPYLQQLTKTSLRVKDPSFSAQPLKGNNQRVSSPIISSFSPARVNAGAIIDPANNLLTITGTGFGTFTGIAAVIFNDGNFAPGTNYAVAANDNNLSGLVIAWTDNQIQIRVPTRASSGLLKVRDQFGNEAFADTQLDVYYSVLNATFSLGGVPYVKQSNLMNVDLNGGYSIYYSTSTLGNGIDLDASLAGQTFKRALNTWKQISGFNITEAGTTTNQLVSGATGICTMMFDNQNTGNAPLAAGVLAVCYSYNTICNSNPSSVQARKTKFDVVIRNNAVSSGTTQFNNGPCSPIAVNSSLTDLETVLFHELGHALNLGHINDAQVGFGTGQVNPGKLMNYSIVGGVKRSSPDASARDGARYCIQPRSAFYGSCNTSTEMTPLATTSESKDECPLSFPTIATPGGTQVAFNMVHTSSNRNVDPAFTQVRCDGVGTPVTNNAYYAVRTSFSGVLGLSVSGYTTNPAALASCTPITSNPVTGFRIAVYQTNSCPTAGSFPSPIACRTFAADGVIPDITGLQANTNYLIFIEAIENTKATFALTFGGSALPIKFTSFTGRVDSRFNQLNWTANFIDAVKEIVIERSTDGTLFSTIGDISGEMVQQKQGEFKDYKPLLKSYYRLKVINLNGTIEYSNTVFLKRNDKTFVTITPNPATSFVEIQITNDKIERYQLRLMNINGQTVYSTAIQTNNAGTTSTKINTAALPKGAYQLVMYNASNNVHHTQTVIVQ